MALIDIFRNAVTTHPSKVALVVNETTYTYADLSSAASRIARRIDASCSRDEHVCGVFAAGTAAAFEGVLGVLLTGRGYVPLNPSFPGSRTRFMIEASDLSLIVVDRNGRARLNDILRQMTRSLTLVMPDADSGDVARWRQDYPDHQFFGRADLMPNGEFATPRIESTAIAYVMFTSGSTGEPKGVMISNENIESFLDAMRGFYDFDAEDRFSQMFDLTFDLSLYDMFVCWGAGAALHVVPLSDRVAPAAFIRRHKLTVWFSVPAVAGFMHQLRLLKPGNFPSLRVSSFCGEPLPANLAHQWQAAAPNSLVDNLYGPTELTVACTMYRWDPDASLEVCEHGVVPIGQPFPGLEAVVTDDRLARVSNGDAGELCVRGPQTSLGYWKQPDLSDQRFVAMPWLKGSGNRWYRTGDLVRRNEAGDLIFVGRVDNQVKILGYRVELGEIEAKLREYGETDFAIAIPWPVAEKAPTGVVACISGSDVVDGDILEGCKRDLPDYMIPKRIFRFDRMPLNSNGKIDRNQLRERVEEMTMAHQ